MKTIPVPAATGEHAPANPLTPVSATGNSITVAAWTIVSRITGLLRFAVIGAVLGRRSSGTPSGFHNSLPNLVFYGFLAGSLSSSLLVPALVSHIDAPATGDHRNGSQAAFLA